MQIRQADLLSLDESALLSLREIDPQLVLVFGAIDALGDAGRLTELRRALPGAQFAGCSTAGEICGRGVFDGRVIVTAVRFDRGRHRIAEATLPSMADSRAVGEELGRGVASSDLAAVLLFGKGVDVNGSALIEGVTSGIGRHVPISGGLAGDGGAFKSTLTVTPSGVFSDNIVAIGLYGDGLEIRHGSYGGWAPFGPARKVTRSSGNVLHELDGIAALDLYREYLGEYAKDLPASGLLFPFEMLDGAQTSIGLIRTIVGIDDATGSLVLAGDIDPDGYLRLMHATKDNLVDGAEAAARRVNTTFRDRAALAILVSCVGRKLVMGDAVDEEVEAVMDVLGPDVVAAGFYSYGEIAPFSSTTDCKLQNQTMTVTLIGEG